MALMAAEYKPRRPMSEQLQIQQVVERKFYTTALRSGWEPFQRKRFMKNGEAKSAKTARLRQELQPAIESFGTSTGARIRQMDRRHHQILVRLTEGWCTRDSTDLI